MQVLKIDLEHWKKMKGDTKKDLEDRQLRITL